MSPTFDLDDLERIEALYNAYPDTPNPVDYIGFFQLAGLDVIPCHAGSKQPMFSGWQRRDPVEQVQQALDLGRPFNLGVRGGGPAGLVIVDCEDEATFDRVVDYLAYNLDRQTYPVVRSASGVGRHIYLRVTGVPAEYDSVRKLAGYIGEGEMILGPRAFAVAPPSQAHSNRSGQTGEYAFLRPLADLYDADPVPWADVAPLIGLMVDEDQPLGVPALPSAIAVSTEEMPPADPVTGQVGERLLDLLPYQLAPTLVFELFDILADAPKGEPIEHPRGSREPYESRSEAEQAIITLLILCGWERGAIKRLFDHHQPGHYAEHANPAAYFWISYRNAVTVLVENPIRQEIAAAYIAFMMTPWPLQSYLAGEVMRALLLLAFQAAVWDPVAPVRTLQELTGGSSGGVHDALSYLNAADYIEERRREGRSYRYPVSQEKVNNNHRWGDTTLHLPQFFSLLHVDGLCYSATPIYHVLSDVPCTVSDIMRETGIGQDTVVKGLSALAEHGLAQCVEDGQWLVGPGLPDPVDEPVQRFADERRPLPSREPVEASEAAVAPSRNVVDDVRRAAEHFEQVWDELGCDHPTDIDPVAVYIAVMADVYEVDWLTVDGMSEGYVHRLQDLQIALEYMHTQDMVSTACVACYTRWAARACRDWVDEQGWAYLYPYILASPGMLAWYARRTTLGYEPYLDKADLRATLNGLSLFLPWSQVVAGHEGGLSGTAAAGESLSIPGGERQDEADEVWYVERQDDGQLHLATDQVFSEEAVQVAREALERDAGGVDMVTADAPVDPVQSDNDPVVSQHPDGTVTRQASTGQQYFVPPADGGDEDDTA